MKAVVSWNVHDQKLVVRERHRKPQHWRFVYTVVYKDGSKDVTEVQSKGKVFLDDMMEVVTDEVNKMIDEVDDYSDAYFNLYRER